MVYLFHALWILAYQQVKSEPFQAVKVVKIPDKFKLAWN